MFERCLWHTKVIAAAQLPRHPKNQMDAEEVVLGHNVRNQIAAITTASQHRCVNFTPGTDRGSGNSRYFAITVFDGKGCLKDRVGIIPPRLLEKRPQSHALLCDNLHAA